jgi:UDP-glucose 4-epimerase
MDLRGRKLLVIGGAGLIGSHTVDHLLREGVAQVVVFDNFCRGTLDNLANALRDPRVSIFEAGGDILHEDVLDAAVRGSDGVFHLAALWLLHCQDYPRSAFDVNIRGTFNVIEACVRHRVQRLVYSSSASVYGDALHTPMGEEHPFNNRTFYGATKIAGEAMLRAFQQRRGLAYTGLRYMNVYGPRQDYLGAYVSVIMRMLDAIDAGQPPVIFGDGSETFDFVAVEDCAAANVLAMQASANDAFFNVGSGRGTSLLDLARLLIRLTDAPPDIRFEARHDVALARHRVANTTRARDALGFSAEIELEAGLTRLVEWRRRELQRVRTRS